MKIIWVGWLRQPTHFSTGPNMRIKKEEVLNTILANIKETKKYVDKLKVMVSKSFDDLTITRKNLEDGIDISSFNKKNKKIILDEFKRAYELALSISKHKKVSNNFIFTANGSREYISPQTLADAINSTSIQKLSKDNFIQINFKHNEDNFFKQIWEKTLENFKEVKILNEN